jgi:hypothetical protein
MVKHGQIETEQVENGADQPLDLAQGRRNTARNVSAVVMARAE